MAVEAKLLVDGEFYNLKSFDYGFVKDADIDGLSYGKTRQAGINCVIEAARQEIFEEWAFEGFMKKYVEIHMMHTITGMGKTRILKCHDTFLLGLKSRFSSSTEEPMNFELFMKSGVIESSASTVAHIEQWSQLPEEVEPTVIEDTEPELLDYYITDLEENKIDNTTAGEKIILHVITKNLVNESLTLSLEDPTADYKFNGKLLENDTLEDYIIRLDHEKIELEVISQGTEE